MEILQTCYEKLLERIIIRREEYYFVYGCFKFQYLISISYIFNILINNLEIFNFDFYLQDVDV